MSIVYAEDIARRLSLTLTDDQKVDLQASIDAYQFELEGELNHVLERRELTVDAEVLINSKVNLMGPIVSVTRVSSPDDPTVELTWSRYDMYRPWLRDSINVPALQYGTVVEVVYVAGDKNPDNQAKSVIADAVIRAMVAGVQVASGAVVGLSVEGTSLSYGAAALKSDPNSKGSFTAGELKTLKHLHRRVVR